MGLRFKALLVSYIIIAVRCYVQSPKRSVTLNDGTMGFAEVITIKVQ